MKLWQKQFIRYGFVGIGSTTIHVVVAFVFLQLVGTSLLIANISAFFSALFFSYFGNALWSFESTSGVKSMGKFLVVSVASLFLIVVISNWVTENGFPPYIGILCVAVAIPMISFVLQKLWVFSQ